MSAVKRWRGLYNCGMGSELDDNTALQPCISREMTLNEFVSVCGTAAQECCHCWLCVQRSRSMWWDANILISDVFILFILFYLFYLFLNS